MPESNINNIPFGLPDQKDGQPTLPSDRGDEVQDRFRYQQAIGATLLAEGMKAESTYKAVWCEHHEDLLVELHTGRYIANQVKTKSKESEEWRNNDDEFVKSVRRFCALEATHGVQIEQYDFCSNAKAYVPAANVKLKATLTSSPYRLIFFCTTATEVSDVKEPYKSALSKLVSATGSTPELVFAVLRKLKFRLGPPLRGYLDSLLVSAIPHIPTCERLTHPQLKKVRDDLVQLVENASGIPTSEMDGVLAYIASNGRPIPSIQGKCITIDSAKASVLSSIRASELIERDKSNHPQQNTQYSALVTTAEQLIESAKITWKMPKFVAPLKLEAMQDADSEAKHVELPELSALLEEGKNLALVGEGGIGKTTYAVELALLQLKQTARVPFYIEGPRLAASGLTVFQYLVTRAQAQVNKLELNTLIEFAAQGKITILINGWNEIPAEQKHVCGQMLSDVLSSVPLLNFVTVSRITKDLPILPKVNVISVKGLTWSGQQAIINAELQGEPRSRIQDYLEKDNDLRVSARSPLILRGIIDLARKGKELSSDVYSLLDSSIETFEDDASRKAALNDDHVRAHHQDYLEGIAQLCTQKDTTYISIEESLVSLVDTFDDLQARRTIPANSTINPNRILETLSTYHLLHTQDGDVRFAHHRFQEFFAARRLLRQLETSQKEALRALLNTPAWDETVKLAANHIANDDTAQTRRMRATLVETALSLDLGLAADLAGICSLQKADAPAIFDGLVTSILTFYSSEKQDINRLGFEYQLATKFSVFSENVWKELVTGAYPNIVAFHRGISILSLGENVSEKFDELSLEAQKELLAIVAMTSDSYDFVVALATKSESKDIKIEAIKKLLWHFPASSVPIDAWLGAPEEIQLDGDLLTQIKYAFESGLPSESILAKLDEFTSASLPVELQIRLCEDYPERYVGKFTDAILGMLRKVGQRNDVDHLISFLIRYAAKEVEIIIREGMQNFRRLPNWINAYIATLNQPGRKALFEDIWAHITTPADCEFDETAIADLMDVEQIRRCITLFIDSSERKDKAQERTYQLCAKLLDACNGDSLLLAVIEQAEQFTYNESAELLKLLVYRLKEPHSLTIRERKPWTLTEEAMTRLVHAFSEKTETFKNYRNDSVVAILSRLASKASPERFETFIFTAFTRYIAAIAEYKEIPEQKRHELRRNGYSGPNTSDHHQAALTAVGWNALSFLIPYLQAPETFDTALPAVRTIIQRPWIELMEKQSGSDVAKAISEGEARRKKKKALAQPELRYQRLTEEVTEILSSRLLTALGQLPNRPDGTVEQTVGIQLRFSDGRIGAMLETLSAIPSHKITEPVKAALNSRYIDLNRLAHSLRNLARLGWQFDLADCTSVFSIIDWQLSYGGYDQHRGETISSIYQALFSVKSTTDWGITLDALLDRWLQGSHSHEVMRALGCMESSIAWAALVLLGNRLKTTNGANYELLYYLGGSFSADSFDQLIEFIRKDELTPRSRISHEFEAAIPKISVAIKDNQQRRKLFLNTCIDSKRREWLFIALEVIERTSPTEDERLHLGMTLIRHLSDGWSTYQMLERFFELKEPLPELGASYSEVSSRASNNLRREIYKEATSDAENKHRFAEFLAQLELHRRERGRPGNEPRHPMPEVNNAWTECLSTVC